MASTLPPVRGATFTFLISLVSQADTDVFQTSVTLAPGDVTVSLDGGGVANITNLPTEIAATGILVVAMTAAQMTADVVTVRFHDAAGAEWQDALVTIYTGAQTFDTTDAIVDTIEGHTDDIGVAGAGLTALGDARLDNLDAAISSRGTADPGDAMDLIADPVNIGVSGAGLTALGDTRLANLDATISSRGTADTGDAMTLATSAVTAIATAVWAYATRTLSSFGTLVATIWSYATRTTTSASTAPGTGLTAQVWTAIRGDTLSRTLSTIAADATITKAQLTVKSNSSQADSSAVMAIDSTSGLLYLNGEDPGAYTGTLVIATGVLTVPAATMARLTPKSYEYDIQVWRTAVVSTIETGTFKVVVDITKLVS